MIPPSLDPSAPEPIPTAEIVAAYELRCAQHGCLVPEDRASDELCPVCNNPLRIIPPTEESV